MKKHRIIMAAICLCVVLSLALTFSGCSDKVSFKNFIKFKESNVEKIEIVSEHNVVKGIAIADVFKAFNGVAFIKTNQQKYESDWSVNRLMTVNFYLKDKAGYYSIVLDIGARAIDGYEHKGTIGFYNVDNIASLTEQLNLLFYAK